jgi:hypothetical protein
VYRTFVKNQRTFDGRRKLVTDYDPTEAPKATAIGNWLLYAALDAGDLPSWFPEWRHL